MTLICRFKELKPFTTINNACYNATTNKHIQISASHLGHVWICGMNVLWHGQTVNLGHLNDWCRPSHHLISHGDQWIAAVAAVKWAGRPCCGRPGPNTPMVWKRKADRKGKGGSGGSVRSKGEGEETEWASRCVGEFLQNHFRDRWEGK